MPDLLSGLARLAPLVTIPSRDAGMVRLHPFFPSQEYILSELELGLAEGIHDFLILKGGRQSAVGGSTLLDVITIYMLQTYSGLVGMMVSDSDDNREYRRDLMLTMLDSLPKSYRQDVRRDNLRMLAWRDNPQTGYRGSRLLFAAAGKREDSNVGRSKGINFNYNDEFGFWKQQRVYSALRASRSEVHPLRFYVDISTANGINTLMHDEWKIATKPTTQNRRAIFASCWRNQSTSCRIERTDPRWTEYGGERLSQQERDWRKAVKRRWGATLTAEFFCWYRWKMEEDLSGDAVLMAQEYGILPEECFQAFGERFIPYGIISRLRASLDTATTPDGFRYEFGKYFDTTKPIPCSPADAPLKVYEEPQPYAVYIVSAHPWGSSSDDATAAEVQVWRAWPDVLELVAEYHTEDPDMYQFAWVCLHMMAAYRSFANSHSYNPVFFILEIGWGGERVLREIDNIRSRGYGLSSEVVGREQFLNMTGCIEYFFRRIDTFASTTARQSKTTGEERARKLFALRDELTREHLVIPSPALVDELSMLRLGEEGKADEIGGGAESPEARAITAAMAVICRLDQDVDTAVRTHIAPKQSVERETHVGEVLVGTALQRLIRTGRM